MLPILALLAGIGQGMEQGKQKELEQEKLEMGLNLLEQQMKDATRKNKLIEELLGMGSAQAAAAPSAPEPPQNGPFRTDPSLRLGATPPQMGGGNNKLFQIAQGVLQGDPRAISEMQALKLAGVDISQEVGAMQKNREFGVRQQEVNQRGIKTRDIPMPGGEIYEEVYDVKTGLRVPDTVPWPKKAATYSSQQVTLPDGSIVLKHFKNTPYGPLEVQPGVQQGNPPSLGSAPPPLGSPGGGTQLKPSDRDMPIPEEQVQMYRGPNGEPMPSGLTPKEAAEQGYRKMTTEEVNNIAARKQFTSVLDQLDTYVSKLFKAEGPLQRALKAPKTAFDLYSQNNPELVAYESFSSGTLAPMIRAIGEKGNLSEGDIQRGIKLIPSIYDTKEVANLKLKQLRGWFEGAVTKAVPVQAPGKADKKKDKLDEFREPGEEKGSDLLNKQRYKTPYAVREAYKAGKIDREQAKNLLKGMGYE